MFTEKEIQEAIDECASKHKTVGPLDYSDGFFDAVEWFKKKLIEKLQQERIEAFHAGYQSNKAEYIFTIEYNHKKIDVAGNHPDEIAGYLYEHFKDAYPVYKVLSSRKA